MGEARMRRIIPPGSTRTPNRMWMRFFMAGETRANRLPRNMLLTLSARASTAGKTEMRKSSGFYWPPSLCSLPLDNQSQGGDGMLPMRRYGEPEDKSVFRSERFFCIDGQWFVYIRESKPLGPFDSRHEAR